MPKIAPILIGTFPELTSTFSSLSSPVRLPTMERASLWIRYTRVADATGARPILAIECHHDATSTAPANGDAGWSRVPVLNGGSYDSGTVTADALAVAFTAVDTDDPVTLHYPGLDVSGAWWLRVRMKEESSTIGGAASVWLTGSSS
jgi:hypothetical protein